MALTMRRIVGFLLLVVLTIGNYNSNNHYGAQAQSTAKLQALYDEVHHNPQLQTDLRRMMRERNLITAEQDNVMTNIDILEKAKEHNILFTWVQEQLEKFQAWHRLDEKAGGHPYRRRDKMLNQLKEDIADGTKNSNGKIGDGADGGLSAEVIQRLQKLASTLGQKYREDSGDEL